MYQNTLIKQFLTHQRKPFALAIRLSFLTFTFRINMSK